MPVTAIQVLDRYIEAEDIHWILIVLTLDNQVVGSCELTNWKRDHVNLSSVAVTPEHRCKGYGTSIIRAAIRIATDSGKQAVGLTVARKNPRAIALYRKLGFQSYTEDDTNLYMGKTCSLPERMR